VTRFLRLQRASISAGVGERQGRLRHPPYSIDEVLCSPGLHHPPCLGRPVARIPAQRIRQQLGRPGPVPEPPSFQV
jgi:hypothetical protein